MGAQIAGHMAGCGVNVLLLDMGQSALAGIEHLKKSKPPAMYDTGDLKLITAGNFENDMPKIAGCDLIVEVVVEKLEIKQKIFAEVEKYIEPRTIISSNTSGILLKNLTDGRSEQFCKNFVITHFFNPVRYMKLVEIVSGPKTDPKIVSEVNSFLTDKLGKGVIFAKDTINFIANRIGVHAVLSAFTSVAEKNWPIEVVDQVMGLPTARPKSAMFRTADIVGLDTFAHVARNSGLVLPAFVEEMLKRGWIGDKAGQGFYKKQEGRGTKDEGRKTEILVLDPKTMEYRKQEKIKTPALGKVREIDDPAERLRTVVNSTDLDGKIAKELVFASINYADSIWSEIADDPDEVDRAMRWGFNWELGPFEQKLAIARSTGHQVIMSAGRRKIKKIVGNAGADITDLGSGVFACEFHTKMNAIDGDVLSMLHQALDMVEKDGVGLVVGNDGAHFSAGANLMMIFLAASNGEWAQIENMVKEFQTISQRMRFCKKPVVVAPFNLALGGGCELSMAGTRIRACAETYMGLVEIGVGLIPAGGGCKNFLLRMEESLVAGFDPQNKIWSAPEDGGPFPKSRSAFQVIAFAKTSSSAKDAKKIGYLKPSDRITLNREHLMEDAKKDVLEFSKNYKLPKLRNDIEFSGAGGKMAIVNSIRQARLKNEISEHDAIIGEKLAHVLTGGDRASTHKTNEQHILDLEREAFLSLCGMPKTLERIQHMLSTGKPLRN